MSYTLFLDDIRFPGPELQNPKIVRTVQEAIEYIVNEYVATEKLPDVISFDHDLGEDEPTAMAFMHWLINHHLDGLIDLRDIKGIIIHSANPVGADNLQALWDGISAEIGSEVRAVKRPRS